MAFDCVEFCKTLGDETRQQILRMLVDQGEMSVGDVVRAFDVSQPTISHHLNILKQFGLVTSRKQGKQVLYDVNRDRITECCGRLIAMFEVEEGVCSV